MSGWNLAIAAGLGALAAYVIGDRLREADTFTLYRASPVGYDMRIHVATFDADQRASYNLENCELTRDLFAGQPGVTVRYWCEKGRFTE